MIPNATQQPLLAESGIKITFTHVMASGKSYKWKNLGLVRLVRTTKAQGEAPTFSLVIATKKSPNAFSLFDTQDADLVGKLQTAIDSVAGQLGARKDF